MPAQYRVKHAYLQFLKAADSVLGILKANQAAVVEALREGDADAIYASTAILMNMAAAVKGNDSWIALELARGHDWSYIGELLALLKASHAVELKKTGTGIKYLLDTIVQEKTPVQTYLHLYHQLAEAGYELVAEGGTLPIGEAPLTGLIDLLTPVLIDSRKGIGVEALRRKSDAKHPLVRLVRTVYAAFPEEVKFSPRSYAEALREYEHGRRKR